VNKKTNKPSINFLYAMLGALENKHWTQYKNQKGEFLLILKNHVEMKKLFQPTNKNQSAKY